MLTFEPNKAGGWLACILKHHFKVVKMHRVLIEWMMGCCRIYIHHYIEVYRKDKYSANTYISVLTDSEYLLKLIQIAEVLFPHRSFGLWTFFKYKTTFSPTYSDTVHQCCCNYSVLMSGTNTTTTSIMIVLYFCHLFVFLFVFYLIFVLYLSICFNDAVLIMFIMNFIEESVDTGWKLAVS